MDILLPEVSPPFGPTHLWVTRTPVFIAGLMEVVQVRLRLSAVYTVDPLGLCTKVDRDGITIMKKTIV